MEVHMPLTGRAWKYGANVDTDQIIAERYGNHTDAAELGKHALQDLDAEFARHVQKGDILVAGSNFGCGLPREVAPLALQGAGVSAVVAASFARMFYRSALNAGLPLFESPAAAQAIEQGHRVEIELASGLIRDLETREEWKSTPFPDFMQTIIAKGGLLPYVEERLAERHADRVTHLAPAQPGEPATDGQV
jgi:3-isopropylmalate/(R)-2-methylmalate dehydratase small subunit